MPLNLTQEEFSLIHRYNEEKTSPESRYINLLKDILTKGIEVPNRTGINAITVPHMQLSFNLSDGFPLFTHKKMAVKTMATELQGFIGGITDKSWYQSRGCHIWDAWCSPKKVKYGNDLETKQKMREENDLGKIYGYQWRNFNSQGFDQLKFIVDQLKTNPNNRQLVCSAWNPIEQPEMSLPPCHLMWNVTALDGKLNLCWMQRSCDFALGVPFNVASYGLLLHLLCKETGLREGKLTGFLSNCHIYTNQIEGVKEIIDRQLFPFPNVETGKFSNIFEWEATDTQFLNYKCGDKIEIPIAV